ncbi:hypothetical protein C4N9_20750 [Pararhodobacter marinus]|uniref:Uncharacterized protein n=1 Tax=Pararhodobacter marinus TaxID=2184063 RepID=A0A2U2C499_9RHOB|nr:hypothetical protein [Pararhodobacter marinus]PWE26693.1 hypothetical protein C4N9_20750 [Pararhodobacter marinus]
MTAALEARALTALRTARDLGGYDDEARACAFAEGWIHAKVAADPAVVFRAVAKVWARDFQIAGPV